MNFYTNFVSKLLEEQERQSAIRLFESATYERFPAESVIFHEGDLPNDKCYVVISGKVGIYRAKVHCDIKISDLGKAATQETQLSKYSHSVYEGEDLDKLQRLSAYGDLLAKLGFGVLFGETALLNQNRRNATVVAMENTEFMIFHKNALDMIKIYYSKDFSSKRDFIMAIIPEITMINNELRITQMIEYFKPFKASKGDKLTEEGVEDNKIYFIQEGEVTLYRSIDTPHLNITRRIEFSTELTPISSLQGKFIVGEECLEGEGVYRYTSIVKSAQTKVYVFERAANFVDFKSFPLFAILLKGYHNKE